MTPDTAPEAITQADREDLAAAAERAGCKVVPSAIRRGEATLISTHIALDALTHLRLTAHSAGEGLAERIRAAVTYAYMPMQVRRLLSEAATALVPPSDAGSTTRSGGEGDRAAEIAESVVRRTRYDRESDNGQRVYQGAFLGAEIALATTPSPDASPDSGDSVTEEMIEAGKLARIALADGTPPGVALAAIYRAMAAVRPSPSPAIVKEAGEVERLRAVLLRICEEDRHGRVVRANPNGAYRGRGGMIAAFALTGQNGSYLTDDNIRAALSASNAAQVSK